VSPRTVLVTGGAGFIGSHLADELLAAGWRVRAFDNLAAQVHGEGAGRPAYLAPDVELMVGDVRDAAALERALAGVDAVVHFAARVGVGQSMYEMTEYASVNALGTTTLLEALARRPVGKLLVASSMSIYGEGRYRDADGRVVDDASRTVDNLRAGKWEPVDASGRALRAVPTPEEKPADLSSVYALTKYDQERLVLMCGRTYAIPSVAMRFFNVYGPRQALSNPYTGVLAIFASRMLNGNAPLIFEDGGQSRDFVHVRDIARACRMALESPAADGHVLNVGTGIPRSVADVATSLARGLGRADLAPRIVAEYRAGDIRHCYADIGRIRALLGFEPSVKFEDGCAELAEWLATQRAEDRTERAYAELKGRGLAG